MPETREYEPGVVVVMEGRCPLHSESVANCGFCTYGHLRECHYPLYCAEANCSYYREAHDAVRP